MSKKHVKHFWIPWHPWERVVGIIREERRSDGEGELKDDWTTWSTHTGGHPRPDSDNYFPVLISSTSAVTLLQPLCRISPRVNLFLMLLLFFFPPFFLVLWGSFPSFSSPPPVTSPPLPSDTPFLPLFLLLDPRLLRSEESPAKSWCVQVSASRE